MKMGVLVVTIVVLNVKEQQKEQKAKEARERARQRARERREYIKRIQEQRETEAQNMAKVIPFRRKNKVIPQFERGDAS
ncbi:hypothetical protein [Thermoactinomyces sp. CICC 10521]|uniref:hypothetical protein n=1 Tax=Thermoactinomyces sp. CICC 10521 TaxID=2767426 RepID=UPI0018DC5608|nr:hypothetical protein [Thermoactinomyces sp. CICC 10521]MBH8606012.1 hypothetical protein [Thermoactinomyces sp. CICC 10521]